MDYVYLQLLNNIKLYYKINTNSHLHLQRMNIPIVSQPLQVLELLNT